ncbi:MAG: HAMP domain-containing histidine kinase [Clostridiales bacterium]|nr:HAMP domain-containing histidine kinase [Clostridiales bacterium]
MKNKFYLLKIKMFLQIVLVAALTAVLGLAVKRLLIDGLFQAPFADGFVRFCKRALHMSYDSAVDLYQLLFRNNKDAILTAGYIFLLLLMITFTITGVTRYFNEIGRALDGLAADDDRPIVLCTELAEVETRLNRVKDTLRRQKREAEEQEQRKNDLILYLAHDIRTPLTSVIGYLELLQSAPDMPVEQRAHCTAIALEKAGRLEELIGEFFDITRFSLQDLPLEKAPFDISLMLRQLADEFYPVLEEQGMRVEVEAADSLEYTGDPNRLARVFNNLLKNAVSYGTPGSSILIRADRPRRHQLSVLFENQGSPIPPEQLPRIFDKFVRLDDARPGHTGGAGLGLAIACEIVERHGGTLQAESDDRSTRFTVLLPCGPLAGFDSH